MSEQKKAIDMTPEELKQWLSSLTAPEDEETPCYYFSVSDPYLKHEPLQENQPRRNIRFDEKGNIVVKNISAYWIPKLSVTEEISVPHVYDCLFSVEPARHCQVLCSRRTECGEFADILHG